MVERLESFSDIIIGFALAQTALTLVIPPNPMDVYLHPIGIFGYLVTFAALARFWWMHAEIFRHYFVPIRIAVFLNFAALASLGLVVFSLQLWLHPGQSTASENAVAKAYFATLAVTYTLLSLLRLLGVRLRYRELDTAMRRDGVVRSVRTICTMLGVFAGATLLPPIGDGNVIFGTSRVAVLPMEIVFGLMAGSIVGRVAAIALQKRDWGAPEKAS